MAVSLHLGLVILVLMLMEASKVTMSPLEVDDVEVTRGKRLLRKEANSYWPRGIVPYKFTKTLKEKFPDEVNDIKMAMSIYQHYTRVRFIPWTETVNKHWQLGHEYYAEFSAKSESVGCFAITGIFNISKAQPITCCGKNDCIHQIGHLLGFENEQQHPDRDDWIRVNWGVVDAIEIPKHFAKLPRERFFNTTYDISSYMNTMPESMLDGSGVTLTNKFPKLGFERRHFYMFKELCKVYKCHYKNPCNGQQLNCENEGYTTAINYQCICRCPPGLDPYNKCKTPIKKVSIYARQPRGKYVLFPNGGKCPDASFTKSHITTRYNQKFEICRRSVKDCSYGTNCYWPMGSYCFFKYGKCPGGPGVSKGKMKFRGEERDFMRFCCFDSGSPDIAVEMKYDNPFTLFMRQKRKCQQIVGLTATQRKIKFYDTVLINGPYSEGTDTKRYIYVCDYNPANLDCGAIIDLSDSSRTIIIQSDRHNISNRDCTWLIRGPNNSGTLILDFEELHVRTCEDSVEVTNSRIGAAGIQYCGTDVKHSIRSVYNKMLIRFQTSSSSRSYFKARVTWKPASDLCYNVNDRGASYGGKVAYTHNFEACIPWQNVTSCPYNPFKGGQKFNILEKNYCRNPDNSLRPWCYTNAKNCERDFCDVCHIEKPYDKSDKCQSSSCTNDPVKDVKCAATCDIKKAHPVQKASDITCPRPGEVSNGILQNSPSPYKVGDTVTYKCYQDSDNEIERICLTSGKWSVANTACTACPLDFGPHKGKCYRYFSDRMTYNDARLECQKYGAELSFAESEDENEHLFSLRSNMKEEIWIAGYFNAKKKAFFWQNGKQIVWKNVWDPRPEQIPILIARNVLHLKMTSLKMWILENEFIPHSFVCRQDGFDKVRCADFVDNCEELLNNNDKISCFPTTVDATVFNPKSVNNFSPTLQNLCRFSCGLCSTGCGFPVKLNEKQRVATVQTDNRYKECTWNFEADLNGGILVVDFPTFDVKSNSDGSCVDRMHLRTSDEDRLKYPHCGSEFKHSVITSNDKVIIQLKKSQQDSKSNFIARVKWVPKSDWCYKKEDKGRTYAGKVSFTENFQPCISWKSAIKCPYNPYSSQGLLSNLEENHCRNPDNSPRPWCYIDTKCQRQYCDVCHWGKPFDRLSTCKKKSGICTNNARSVVLQCAETCSREIMQPVTKVSDVTCGPLPNPAKRGPQINTGNRTTSYKVGDSVYYDCTSKGKYYEEYTCLTSGQWVISDTRCTACKVGYAYFKMNPYDEHCYIFEDKKLTYNQSVEFCASLYSKVSTSKGARQNVFLDHVRKDKVPMWLGGGGTFKTGFQWNDNKQTVDWFNWASGGVRRDKAYNHIYMDSSSRWRTATGNEKFNFICKYERYRKFDKLEDVLDSCPTLFPQKSKCETHQYLKNLCPKTCDMEHLDKKDEILG